jgi:hypothetical protein
MAADSHNLPFRNSNCSNMDFYFVYTVVAFRIQFFITSESLYEWLGASTVYVLYISNLWTAATWTSLNVYNNSENTLILTKI